VPPYLSPVGAVAVVVVGAVEVGAVVVGLVVVVVVVAGFVVVVVVDVLLQATSNMLITRIKPNRTKRVFFIHNS
jgi:hypothetical protein